MTKTPERYLARAREYRKIHKNEIKIRRARYYAEHRDELKGKTKIYQRQHPEKVRGWKSKYRTQNHEEIVARRRELREANPAKCHQKDAEYRASHKEHIRDYRKQYHAKVRTQLLAVYGYVCVCCGEVNPMFLTVDHINNDGARHRTEVNNGKSGGASLSYLRKILALADKSQFQTLCYNCNCGKARNGGICPHKMEVVRT